jgi:hypothetical protein
MLSTRNMISVIFFLLQFEGECQKSAVHELKMRRQYYRANASEFYAEMYIVTCYFIRFY